MLGTAAAGRRPQAKSGAAGKWIGIAAGVVILGVGVYFALPYLTKHGEQADQKAAAADKATNSASPAGGASVAADGAATNATAAAKELPLIPAVWNLEVDSVKIPESRLNGTLTGVDFMPETTRVDPAGPSHLLRFYKGTPASPDGEIRVFFKLKPGEKVSGHNWTVAKDARNTGISQVVKLWKPDPKYAPRQQPYYGGFALKLEFGELKDGQIPGKIFVALPDTERSVLAGVFTAQTSETDNPAAAAAQAAAPVAPVQPKPAAMDPTMQRRYGPKR
jgi:hypothetical protein